MNLSRRHSLAIGAGLLAMPAISSAQALARVRLTLDWAFQAPNSFALTAREKGFFREAGVEVQVDRGNGSGGVPVALAGGA